ncbi:iron sulfur cluster assembly protein 1, mitochondrial [[Candida] jaroonii]|uniref:Iron sulfur cluster assembly protein 1, mitochondrial n=1 Tax=[Candida] jaroonii TaxID=467808 RepID=A0ACA9Y701_9ASCO|nr:iron sulfur cluster assembly protein 1, mitochondrial [[Candida] jaroonii]
MDLIRTRPTEAMSKSMKKLRNDESMMFRLGRNLRLVRPINSPVTRLTGINGVNNLNGATSMVGFTRSYHENVLKHYSNPQNVGTLNKNSLDVGTGLVGAPACGDVMRLQIEVDEETGIIKQAKFKTFGCGSAIASSSYLTSLIKGLSLEEAGKLKNTQIAKELNLPPVKLHCSMLAEDAVKSAIKDYKSKRSNKTNLSEAAVATS